MQRNLERNSSSSRSQDLWISQILFFAQLMILSSYNEDNKKNNAQNGLCEIQTNEHSNHAVFCSKMNWRRDFCFMMHAQ